jgi:hypothetical protein
MYMPLKTSSGCLEIVEQNHSKYVGLIKRSAANEYAVFDGQL